MEQILIFAGTKEGRLLAEHLTRQGIDVHISVATAYGKEVLQQREGLVIHQGRLSQPEMEALLKEQEWEAVVDATHPYAREVSKNLREACKTTGKMYLRLLREPSGEEESWGGSSGKAKKEELRDYYYVDTKEEAAAFLNETEGNILLTTGSKELRDYIRLLDDPSRIYARILPDGGMVNQCRSWGLSGSQIICMQGPFSAELNAAMLKQVNAKYLVTKDTGDAGGFLPKLAGARAAKAKAVVIRRPGETEGFFMNQLLEYLKLPPMEQKGGSSKESHASPRIFLLGIGMGSVSGMTGEAVKACECADVILGAGRMLETLSCFGKPMEDMYDPYEILGFIKRHPEYQNIVAAFSGDIGFYSGTKRLLELLETEAYQVEVICGISSAAYAAAKLHMPWQDMKLVSIHGRPQNLIGAVRAHEKVFALAGKIKKGGLVEVPMGMTLREVLYGIGGGIKNDKKFKAVQMGGPSGGCIPAELIDTPVTYEDINKTGAIVGSGGMIVMDEDTCMVDMARYFLNFTRDESCGKCNYCRIGTKRMLEILERITRGEGKDGDIEKLEELAMKIKDGSLCGLGQTAPNPVLTTLKYFRNEYEDHIYNHKCTAGSCKALISYTITDACKGCTACSKKCPVGAITGTVKEKHVIDKEKCIKCGKCLETCKFGAIEKK